MEEVERYEPDARLLWLASYLGACINKEGPIPPSRSPYFLLPNLIPVCPRKAREEEGVLFSEVPFSCRPCPLSPSSFLSHCKDREIPDIWNFLKSCVPNLGLTPALPVFLGQAWGKPSIQK